MLFSSYTFILIFLPCALGGFALTTRFGGSRLEHSPNAIDFSTYNEIGEVIVSEHMKYWYEPVRPSMTAGNIVLSILVPATELAVPQNFRVDLNVDTVDARLRETQEKLEAWIAANPEYQTAYRDVVAQLVSSVRADTHP